MTIGMSFPPPAAAGSRRPHTFLCRDLQKNCPLPSRQEQAVFLQIFSARGAGQRASPGLPGSDRQRSRYTYGCRRQRPCSSSAHPALRARGLWHPVPPRKACCPTAPPCGRSAAAEREAATARAAAAATAKAAADAEKSDSKPPFQAEVLIFAGEDWQMWTAADIGCLKGWMLC